MGQSLDTWKLEAGNEWTARDPFGRVKPVDRSARDAPVGVGGAVKLRGPRNGYVSFRLWVGGSGAYRLRSWIDSPLQIDLFRAWYHHLAEPKPDQGGQRDSSSHPRYLPDALIPVAPDGSHQLPDPDNRVAGQTHQEFWVDLFIPPDAKTGEVRGGIELSASGRTIDMGLLVEVLDVAVPDEDAVVCNRHSFGSRWLDRQYPSLFPESMDIDHRYQRRIELLHHLHRLNREHRGLFTNRGVGHANTFDPIYGPTLVGRGRDKRIDDWTLFDRYHAPLLDGSAFRSTSPAAPPARRPARPVWAIPTPMNAEWPADYLHWGQPGYRVEFVNCVRQFDAHLRANAWTASRPYLFFVHKKRYRWMDWDGDEPKYAKDDAYALEIGRMFREAIAGSPVPWTFRLDASWQMVNEFTGLAGVVDWWVCGSFIRWWPAQVRAVLDRGDRLWSYSGTPPIDAASSGLLEHVFRTWGRGLGGNCEWCTHSSCPDPWFASDGNATQIYYPGDRFGIPGPIPSARLKLQRNAVQDVTLISARAGQRDAEVRAALARTVPVRLWEQPPRVVRERSPEEWDSRNLSASQDDQMAAVQTLDPLWWMDIRRAALERGAS